MVVATTTAMLAASISFRVRADKRGEAVNALETLVERMTRVAGCTRARVLASVDDGNALTLTSEWTDMESADAYFESRDFRVFRGLRILFRDEPSIVLDEVHGRRTKLLGEH